MPRKQDNILFVGGLAEPCCSFSIFMTERCGRNFFCNPSHFIFPSICASFHSTCWSLDFSSMLKKLTVCGLIHQSMLLSYVFHNMGLFIFSVTILAVHPGGMCLHEGLVSFCLYLYLWVNQPVIVVADPYLFWFQRKKILPNECKTNPFTKVITSFINQSKLIRTGPWHSKSNPLLIKNGQCIAIYAAFH